MTADQYVEMILAKYAVPRGPTSPAEKLGETVAGPLRTWAGQQLNALQYSGSYAKETGVRGTSDVDVFISLKSDTRQTLKERYEMLVSLAQNQGWSPRRQNVSVGITVNGTSGDLVPGKVQEGYQLPQSLPAQAGLVDADERGHARGFCTELWPIEGDPCPQDLANAPRARFPIDLPRAVRNRRPGRTLTLSACRECPPCASDNQLVPDLYPNRRSRQHQQHLVG